MEKLSIHIEYLLRSHDCVIIPYFGAFLNVYEAPKLDFKNHIITPPIKEIRFNQALKSDDGLLSNSFARKYSIPFREGAYMVEECVKELASTLFNDGELTLGRIGILKRGEDGAIIFYPYKTNSRRASDEGLSPTLFSTLNTKQHKEGETQIKTSLRSKTQRNEEIEYETYNNTPIKKIKEGNLEKFFQMDFSRNYYVPINKLAVKVSACVVLISLFIVTLFLPQSEIERNGERASVLPFDKVLDTALRTQADKKSIPSIPSSNTKEDAQEEHSSNLISDKKDNFYLIVATCKSENEAKKWISSHNESGYDFKILASKKLYRVFALVSSDRNSLVDTMASQNFKSHFSSSWIYRP